MSGDCPARQAAPQIPRPQENGRTLWRFIRSLGLVHRLIVPIVCVVMLASSAPQFYLWYVGEYVKCTAPSGCATEFLGMPLPLTIAGLLLIALFGMLCRITGWAAFELSGQWSTNKLHDQMIAALAAARTTYFDETPSGHLINRITGDFGNLRVMGVIRLGDSLNAIAEVLAIAILVLLVSPWPALAMLPVTLAFLRIQLHIGPMLGRSQELSSACRGEVLHRETDLIEGNRIFALYAKREALMQRLHDAYAELIKVRLLSARLQAWARIWVRIIAAFYGFLVFLFLTIGVERGQISLTLAAVIVSAMFALSGSFGWLSWCLTFLTETLGNARRVFELVDLPTEVSQEHAPSSTACQARLAAPAGPPAKLSGDIAFIDFHMGYRAGTPEILKGLNLTIRAGRKTGIIGRTGAGKSSLVQALFRMVHVTGGDIQIGGQSIYGVEITLLRRQFGVVPQNPYLFAGSIRTNLDRSGLRRDQELIDALRIAGLTWPLDMEVHEGGRNLSVGERQLLCLARVMISDKRYIIMDEPTSAVDMQTDANIQQLLARQLADRTVITIAHRLDTLRLYDHVIELSEGQVLRQGRPELFLGGPPGKSS